MCPKFPPRPLGSGGELASAAPGGGRPEDLRPALCLLRRTAEGKAVSKQRLAHWIVEAIVLAYQARRLPCPLGVRAHSTRGVASSWALRGAPR